VAPDLAARIRPITSARQRLLPVAGALAPLLPDRALRRGATLLVVGTPGGGATTLGLGLLAAASAAGWCAVVGLADPGVVAMAELGIDLDHVALVPRPRRDWAEVAGDLLAGVDVVLVQPPGRAGITAARHLSARARERRSVLVVLGADARCWAAGPDLILTVGRGSWGGLGRGDGHLRERRLEVAADARRSGPPARRPLLLPAPDGAVAPDEG
jgi:hypothetical protein